MPETPRQLAPDAPDIPAVLALIQEAFAGMEGRIDPPSSMHRLDVAAIAEHCAHGEVWVMGAPVMACVFLTGRSDHLYLSKLAVAEARRGEGLARRLAEHAVARARDLSLPEVRLQTRIELTENHAAFRAMAFVQIGETAHPGYDRPTSLTFARRV